MDYMPKEKEFKSLFIDLENKIFLLNGEEMKGVSELKLTFEGEWSLLVTRDELYVQAATEIKG